MNLGIFGQLSMRLETLEPANEPGEERAVAAMRALALELGIPAAANERGLIAFREARRATPTWLTATCTNCGATTEVDTHGRCEPCGTPNEEVYGS